MAAFDAVFTEKQLAKYGVERELNRFTRLLVGRLGLRKGVWLSLGLPTAVIAILGVFCHPLLWFLTGARTTLFAFQLEELERQKITRSGRVRRP